MIVKITANICNVNPETVQKVIDEEMDIFKAWLNNPAYSAVYNIPGLGQFRLRRKKSYDAIKYLHKELRSLSKQWEENDPKHLEFMVDLYDISRKRFKLACIQEGKRKALGIKRNKKKYERIKKMQKEKGIPSSKQSREALQAEKLDKTLLYRTDKN